MIGSLKLAGAGVGAAALLFLAWGTFDRFQMADEVRGHRACAAAVESPAGELGRCDGRIRAVALAARRGQDCEAAIGDGDLYAVRASCGEQVKRLGARLAAAEAKAADLTQQLGEERQGRAAAIARAEQRAAVDTQRRNDQDDVIRRQPRSPDGRVRCDARCMRELAGDAPR